jgi:hypothetical protein
MNLCQLNEKGDFLAVQEFYKGFQSKTAGIARVWKDESGWHTRRVIDLPFVHRFCVQKVGEAAFVVACTLCEDKNSPADWSRPGKVFVGRIPDNWDEPCILTPLIEGIYKNHGLYQGKMDGRNVVLVTGEQGVFRIDVPQSADAPWAFARVLDREISDVTAVDLDGDGEDELVTIEGFHGSVIAVNKRVDGAWKVVTTYPVALAHALWGGDILGKPGVLVGYRQHNGALIMLRFAGWRSGKMLLSTQIIDEHEEPTNIAVIPGEEETRIFCSSGSTYKVVLYKLT